MRGPRLFGLPAVAWLVLGLAGCAVSLPAPDRAELRVEGEPVTIVAPAGLCIDPRTLDVGRRGGQMLIGDCAVLGLTPDAPPSVNGILNVSVSTGGLPEDGLAALGAFLNGPGVATLGRGVAREQVSVLETRLEDDTLYLKIDDPEGAVIPGAANDYWRVFFPAGPRLVLGSLTSFAGAPVSDAQAVDLLADLSLRTRAANAPDAGS